MDDALVSVIIPTYKRADMLGKAIESILNQTYPNIEVVVVDDNDQQSIYRKKTETFMEKYRDNPKVIYLMHAVNKNGAAARNTGIRYSKAEYIAFLDDDDEFHQEKVALQLKKLSECGNEKVGAVYCNYKRYQNGESSNKSTNRYIKDEGNLLIDLLLEKNEIAGGSTLFVKKEVINELGGFDESFQRHQDWEFLIRFFRKYELALCEEFLVNINTNDAISMKAPSETVGIKEHYLTTFQNDIERLPQNLQRKIYSKQWAEVALKFFQIDDFENGNYYFKKAMDFGGISAKDLAKLFAYKYRKFQMVSNLYARGKKIFTKADKMI